MSHFNTTFRGALKVAALWSLLIAPVALAQWPSETARFAVGKDVAIATAHPLATQAAQAMLVKGGNAVDAAVAAAFTIGVVEPDGSGLGGGGGMLIFLGKSKRSVYVNYYQRGGERLDELPYNRETDRQSPRASLVPGTVAGLTRALEDFGTLPLPVVLEPAIAHAEGGFAIDKTLAQIILDNYELCQQDSTTAAIYLDEGFPRPEGDILVQKDLGGTLRLIAEKGRAGFYEGVVAEAIVRDVNKHGGVLTVDDIKSYREIVSVPLKGTYRGYDVLSANVPQSGAAVIEALNILENAPLYDLGHPSQSAESLHLFAETLRRTYADRSAFIADPLFEDFPLKGLTSKAYALERFLDIKMERATPARYRDTKPGTPARFEKESDSRDLRDEEFTKRDLALHGYEALEGEAEPDEGGHTTHLVVVDSKGNMVSLTQTLGTFFGSGLTTAGVLMNNARANFARTVRVNKAESNKQPRSSICPTILLKDGEPVFAVGSPGSIRIISTVVQLITNVVDYGMDANEANDAPRFFCQKFTDYLFLESRIGEEVRNDLEAKGHTLEVYGEYDLFFGGAQMILFDPTTKTYQASADPRRGGAATAF
jgi:gamma-glutamyltranspeptidase/glutathione hydrolase